jgi:hypothetical protein
MGNKICKQCDQVAIPQSKPQLCHNHYFTTPANTCRGYHHSSNLGWVFCTNKLNDGLSFCDKCTCTIPECKNPVNRIGWKNMTNASISTTCTKHMCVLCKIRARDKYAHCDYCRCTVDGCDEVKDYITTSYRDLACKRHTCEKYGCIKKKVDDNYEACGIHTCAAIGCKKMKIDKWNQCINCINLNVRMKDNKQSKQQEAQHNIPPKYENETN